METKETMDTYIRESEEVLLRNLSQKDLLVEQLVEAYLESRCEDILMIASGSSYNACRCAEHYMAHFLGVNVKVVTPDAFVHYEQNLASKFCFVVSQSGSSTNAIEALDKLKRSKKTAIGLTGNRESEFKNHSDVMIDYGVGEEKVGYVTKGVVTLILYLNLFSLESSHAMNLIGEQEVNAEYEKLQNIISSYPDVYQKTQHYISENFNLLTSMSTVYVLGNHTAYSIALEAALKIGETVCIPSFAYESEEFLHGPNLQLTPAYSVFIIDANDETSARTQMIFNAVSSVTQQCFYIGIGKEEDDPRKLMIDMNVDHHLLPFVYLQIFQSIAYQVTESLNRWQKHPVYSKNFGRKIQYKI